MSFPDQLCRKPERGDQQDKQHTDAEPEVEKADTSAEKRRAGEQRHTSCKPQGIRSAIFDFGAAPQDQRDVAGDRKQRGVQKRRAKKQSMRIEKPCSFYASVITRCIERSFSPVGMSSRSAAAKQTQTVLSVLPARKRS